MNPAREKEIELKARDDARETVNLGLDDAILGMLTFGLTLPTNYRPPSDEVEQVVYRHAFDQETNARKGR